MECRDIQYRISEWVDGGLKETEITEVEAHVSLCRTCCHIYDDFRNLKEASLDLAVFEPSDRVWSNIRAHLVFEGVLEKEARDKYLGKAISSSLLSETHPCLRGGDFLTGSNSIRFYNLRP